MQEEISLLDLWKLFRKHAFMIITISIIGALLSGAFMVFLVDSEYKSEAQLIVNQAAGKENQNIQYSDLQTSIGLINTYRDIVTSPAVLEKVADQLGNELSVTELKKSITVNQSQNSQSFTISAVMESPELAQTVVESLTEEFNNTLLEIYQEDISKVFILSPASYNPNRVSPSLMRYLLIGAVLGLMLSMLLALIQELSDTSVKDEDFLMSIGLINLGEVSAISKKDRAKARLANQVETRQSSRRKV